MPALCGWLSARGMCTRNTHEKIIAPDNTAASRVTRGTMMPMPPAIKATPQKYVQNTAPGIQEGTSEATNGTYMKC